MKKARSKYKHIYIIKLSDEENELLYESAHEQNMQPKYYIINLIVMDCFKKMIERSHLITSKNND